MNHHGVCAECGEPWPCPTSMAAWNRIGALSAIHKSPTFYFENGMTWVGGERGRLPLDDPDAQTALTEAGYRFVGNQVVWP